MVQEGILYWVVFNIIVVGLLLLDLGLFHRKDSVVTIKQALLWTVFWIALALLFNVFVYFDLGKEKAMEFLTGYMLEKSLSIDNLFVFVTIFSYFGIAPMYQHKVLFWGILGALVMRAIFIFLGVALISKFSFVMIIFGAFLIFSGIKMLKDNSSDDDFNPEDNIVLKLFKKIMPVTADNQTHSFFTKINGKHYATTLFLTLLFIEVSDLIFAVDSIPAVLSVSQDTFIVYTSNIFAILGLRSLYFALAGTMQYFQYLRFALAGILSFVGIKMILNELSSHYDLGFKISNIASLLIIIGSVTLAILLSIYKNKKQTSNKEQ